MAQKAKRSIGQAGTSSRLLWEVPRPSQLVLLPAAAKLMEITLGNRSHIAAPHAPSQQTGETGSCRG